MKSVPLQNQPRENRVTYKFNCSFVSRWDCPVQARIKEDSALITLEFNERHHESSYKGLVHSRITESQKKALEIVVRINRLCIARTARRATQNMDEDENDKQGLEECP